MPNQQPKVLLVDSNLEQNSLLAQRLIQSGFKTKTSPNSRQALSQMTAWRPHLIVTDHNTGDGDAADGIGLLQHIQRIDPTLPVIVLTANGTIADAVNAMRKGAFSFLKKPVAAEIVAKLIIEALNLNVAPGHQIRDSAGRDPSNTIVTRSPRMQELLRQARLVATSGSSAFIQGESGTGKELLVQAIHQFNARRGKPLKILNCSAIPENLLESELFGHRKGAFTGAIEHHQGLFQAADGGILFLDEIGDMPLLLQAKLLRALQERRVRPVGATESVPVNVQIISATHRDLEQSVKAGHFRQDLYYRLNVIMLELPPLRDRREDIPLLVNYFLKKVAVQRTQNLKTFSPEAMEMMLNATWPGNVRQLSNVIEYTTLLSASDVIPASLVEKSLRERPQRILTYTEAKYQFERKYLSQVMKIASGNVSKAAVLANRNRTEFYRLLTRCQLEPELFRVDGD